MLAVLLTDDDDLRCTWCADGVVCSDHAVGLVTLYRRCACPVSVATVYVCAEHLGWVEEVDWRSPDHTACPSCGFRSPILVRLVQRYRRSQDHCSAQHALQEAAVPVA